jgi:hypothetical protein
MKEPVPQSFENHARIVPGFHMGVFGVVVASFLWSAWRLLRAPSAEAAMGLLLALGLAGMLFYMRSFALTVQDRVIRLEMRLRLEQVLPPDLEPRIPELGLGQLIALRFASNAELPELVRAVLTEDIRERKAIKRRIKSWQADHLRC